MSRARFAEILRLFAANDVEFVVVGMTAGILHGAPVTTIDLDVVHRRSPERGLSGSRPELPALIDAKERAGRAKDLAALPVLRATLDERQRR